MKNDEVTIYLGGLHVSSSPVVIRTVVGACIAVCLHDSEAGVGGMNHFLLPAQHPPDDPDEPSRFGVNAMELLVSGIQRLGGQRRRLRAKIFGGGQIFAGVGTRIAQSNIRFILSYASAEGLEVASQDLGGSAGRRLLFHTGSGKAFVKRLGGLALRAARLRDEEAAEARSPDHGKVVLFDGR